MRAKKPTRRMIDFMERKSIKLDPKEWYFIKNSSTSIVFLNINTKETKEFIKSEYTDIYF